MTDEIKLPEPAMTEYTGGGKLGMIQLHYFTADQVRAAVLEAKAQERERILSELEAMRCNEKAVNMTGHDVVREELLDDIAAAIRAEE